MSSTDRRSAEEIIAAEAQLARENMSDAEHKFPKDWFAGWFNAVTNDYPQLKTPEHRASFMRLATASSQGES
jgi:hypothetical protein